MTKSARRATWMALALVGLGLLSGAGILRWLRRAPRNDEEARTRLARRDPSPAALNLVVVTLDTLRADRLGCYGFRGVETPHIDRLASEGILFEQATSTAPLTFPSHASIFTGLVPPHHGVRDNGGFFLEAARTTLAERLKATGAATGAFIGAWVLDSRWGLDQGFDRYADRFDLSKYKTVSLGTVQKPGDEVMDQALAWLETVADRRFFAWVHLYDPHTPYEPPEPYRSRYSHPYLGEVAYTDAVVGRLASWLRDKGLMDRTVIALLGDHGEGLGDHGESAHSFFIYDSTVSVPLIVRTPWGDRGRVRTQVSTVDLFPTLLDLLGLPPQAGIDGRSLVRAVIDPEAQLGLQAYSETYYPRYHYGWQQLRSLRDGRYKFVDAPQAELYDLESDPGETRNVYAARREAAEHLRARLSKLGEASDQPAPERQSLDPETLQRLAALGYVGNTADVDPNAVLPDPKEKIGIYALMNAAKAAAQNDRLSEAIAKMREVLARDPQIVDAHVTLGNWLRKDGRNDEAIEAFKQALRVSPSNELALTNLANLYRTLGRHQAAIEGYRSVLRLEPRNPQTWYHLATLYLDLDRVGEAEKTFREALASNPKMGAAYNSLGAIAWSRNELNDAEALIRKGLELEPEVRTGRFNLARILEARRRPSEAETLYRQELEIYPDHGRARFNLAQLLRERGDREAYLRELRLGTEKSPDFGAPFFFLAREELKAGRLEAAADLARRGLETDSVSDIAPLGHYVLADVFNRQGDPRRAQEEVAKARRLEAERRRAPAPRI